MASSIPSPPDRRVSWLLVAACAGVALRSAWVCDDAYVTLRTLEHLCAGYGPRYNVAERVQAYTHPLWLLWMWPAYALTREAWLTPMFVGLATTAAALGVGISGAPARAGAVALAIGFVGSKASVDYATSGLENPLLDLGLAWFAAEWFGRRRPTALVTLGSLLVLTRPDAALLVGPALVGARRGWRGLAPLAAWGLFALAYYGSLVPNTFYAKLGAGVPLVERLQQGAWYFLWAARTDPWTLGGIALGLAFGEDRALRWGISAHLGYVLWIGGDFMGGRFFAAPLWVALLLLSRRAEARHVLPAAAALLASCLSPYAPLRSGAEYTRAPALHGVVDERGYYWAATGLWSTADRERALPEEFRAAPGATGVEVKSIIGMYGYAAGPGLHVIDRNALADPLLARLPAEPGARVGHLRRAIPEGYVDSVAQDANRIADPAVRDLYDRVRLVTRAPLFAPGRWRAILALSVGIPGGDAEAPVRRRDARSGNRTGSRR